MIVRGYIVFHVGCWGVVQLGIYERKIPGSKSDLHTMIVELIVNPLAADRLAWTLAQIVIQETYESMFLLSSRVDCA